MNFIDVIKYQENLAEKYKYKALPPIFRMEALQIYSENLPEYFELDGDNVPLFSPGGLKLCNKYNRIVIGDYGAFVEILPDDIVHSNIEVKKGQEYRDYDERYSKHTKYSWLTAKDNSDIKIYFQKKEVDYADYVPGCYYISPYECSFAKDFNKDVQVAISKTDVSDWLQKNGVYTDELLDYYMSLHSVQKSFLKTAIKENLLPCDFEFWLKIDEICNLEEPISCQQFQAINYNLCVIDFQHSELKTPLESLNEDIKTAILMGIEEITFPIEMQELSAAEIRMLLNLSIDRLLDVTHFSKLVAGCKADYSDKIFVINDVSKLVSEANIRANNVNKNVAQKSNVEQLLFN